MVGNTTSTPLMRTVVSLGVCRTRLTGATRQSVAPQQLVPSAFRYLAIQAVADVWLAATQLRKVTSTQPPAISTTPPHFIALLPSRAHWHNRTLSARVTRLYAMSCWLGGACIMGASITVPPWKASLNITREGVIVFYRK